MKIRSVLLLSSAFTVLSITSLAQAQKTDAIQPAPGESGEILSTPSGRQTVIIPGNREPETTQLQQSTVIEEILPPDKEAGQKAYSSETLSKVDTAPPAPAPDKTAPYTTAIDETAKINASTEVLQEITSIPEGISPTLLSNSYGIVIIPGTIKLGFFFGGQYGSGIAMVRNEDGSWSNPSFVYLAGGSFGLQFGAVSSDIILVFKTKKSVVGMAKGNFTLGADAAVAAGPVGRRAVASTDWQLKAEIYSYARSRGLFAGISLDGSVLAIDTGANAAFYGTPGVSASDVFASAPSSSPAVIRMKSFLTKISSIPAKE
ncbi:MAG: lipid-binding SYLF domain-containing protein [Geobacteraceae bacterium]|nr:lipid-binding SYLF domain-containing protein [Geobacteraceae bacterium]